MMLLTSRPTRSHSRRADPRPLQIAVPRTGTFTRDRPLGRNLEVRHYLVGNAESTLHRAVQKALEIDGRVFAREVAVAGALPLDARDARVLSYAPERIGA